jgi:anthranilate phosphoribosyltransferase
MNPEILGRVSAGENLSFDEMSAVIDEIMRGEWPNERIALLLTALATKGESVDEVAGAAFAMRRHMTPIRTRRRPLVDTCGTGGGGGGSFNISTASALVTAAAGVAVAKHGNRKITSQSGSADALEQLGVNVMAPIEVVERCLDELGVCFCFAPQCHPAMKNVAQVRRELGRPSIFNLLGPLCNPAGAQFQVLGVVKPELRALLAAALKRLGTERALVVCAEDRLGELTLGGATELTEIRGDTLTEYAWRPEDFGLSPAPREALVAADPSQSAERIRGVLAGQRGPARDVVVMNSAAALWVVGERPTLPECASLAAEAIDSGAAGQLLAKLVAMSNGFKH